MYELIVHDDAADDLARILEQDPPAGALLVALLQELENNEDLLDRLTQRDFGGTPAHPRPKHARFNVTAWGKAQNHNMNLWRFRSFEDELSSYRCVYAFQPEICRYVILGVGLKAEIATTMEEFDYELDSDLSLRIQRAYHRLMDE